MSGMPGGQHNVQERELTSLRMERNYWWNLATNTSAAKQSGSGSGRDKKGKGKKK
jgi:hypothetical protein